MQKESAGQNGMKDLMMIWQQQLQPLGPEQLRQVLDWIQMDISNCQEAGFMLLTYHPDIVNKHPWLITCFASIAYSPNPLEKRLPLILGMAGLETTKQVFFLEQCWDRDEICCQLLACGDWEHLLALFKVSLLRWGQGAAQAEELFWLLKHLITVVKVSQGKKANLTVKTADGACQYNSVALTNILVEESLQAAVDALLCLLHKPGGPQLWAENDWIFQNDALASMLLEQLAARPVVFALWLEAFAEITGGDYEGLVDRMPIPKQMMMEHFLKALQALAYGFHMFLEQVSCNMEQVPMDKEKYIQSLEKIMNRLQGH